MDEELNAERASALRLLANHSQNGWSTCGDGALGLFTGIGSFTSNGVLTTRGDVDIAELHRLAEPFAGHPSAPWSLQVGPSPAERESRLARRLGLDQITTLPTMTIDPRESDFAGPAPRSRFKKMPEIRAVTAHDGPTFGMVISRALGLPPSQAVQFSSVAVLTAPEVTALWAVDAVAGPVAAGISVTTPNGFTGLFAIGTVRGERRRGIGAAITAALVADAHDRGSHTSFLQASPPDKPVYAALGFRVAEELTYYF